MPRLFERRLRDLPGNPLLALLHLVQHPPAFLLGLVCNLPLFDVTVGKSAGPHPA
ncbi:MAG: hypothetical protein M3Q08_07195 [Pseudomonadota bacterium]|nr:hypothetical protein [Pseudomonadota bacterium]